jgi:hypothetical protein
MTMQKHKLRGMPGKLWTLEASSDALQTDRTMTYWLEKISPEDIGKLWKQLRAYAKDAKRPITWVQWASGTITQGQDFRVDVTAYTTHDGFAVRFTVTDTSI